MATSTSFKIQHRWFCKKCDALVREGDTTEHTFPEKEMQASSARLDGLEVFTTKEGPDLVTVIGHSDESCRTC